MFERPKTVLALDRAAIETGLYEDHTFIMKITAPRRGTWSGEEFSGNAPLRVGEWLREVSFVYARACLLYGNKRISVR
jgi:hypothetical protein